MYNDVLKHLRYASLILPNVPLKDQDEGLQIAYIIMSLDNIFTHFFEKFTFLFRVLRSLLTKTWAAKVFDNQN